MADLDGGQHSCPGCGALRRPDDVPCPVCGATNDDRSSPAAFPAFPALPAVPGFPGPAGGDPPYPPAPPAPPGPVGGGPFPPVAPGPLVARAGAGGRGSNLVAPAWGAVSVAFGLLVLAGAAMPWFTASTFALTDDLGSAWPILVIGLVGVAGGIDGLRGSVGGPAVAAGVGSVFVLVQVVMFRFLTLVPGVTMGSGGAAWTLAAGAAALLLVAVLSIVRVDRAAGVAPGWLSALTLAGGTAWVAGMLMPAAGMSLGDHVELVLLGGDTFSDVLSVAFIGVPAALAALAAASRSRAAHGLAAGSMVFWVLATVSAAAGHGSSGDGTLRYAYGSFWPMLLGPLGVAVAGCLALLVPAAAPSGPGLPPVDDRRRPAVPFAPALGLALLPIAGVVGATQYAEGGDAFGASYGTSPVYETGGSDPYEVPAVEVPADAYDDYDDYDGSDGDGGSVDVVCTDAVDSRVDSAWQDVDGAIHVVVLVDNGCGIDQQLADPSASFTLTSAGATVASGEFDFSSDPVVVAAMGIGEAEIVFGPATFVDLASVETLGLGSASSAGGGDGSLGLTYSYSCTDVPVGTSTGSAARPAVDGDPTAAPIAPAAPTGAEALDRLGEIARADAPFVESDVIDRWVPQISSKKPDVTLPNGTVWDASSILQDHRTWRERFPRVRLLWSGDLSTFKQTDFWVTIVAVPFDTPEGALGWCDANGLPTEDCYAKLVSHTHPPEGSTQLR